MNNQHNYTFQSLLQRIQKNLNDINVCGYEQEYESWQLLMFATKKTKTEIFLIMHEHVSDTIVSCINALLEMRVTQRKPLAYIIGFVDFLDLTIEVEPPILIPRQETEEIVTWFLHTYQNYCNKPLKILDMCTGSGCIGLSLAKKITQSHVVLVDNNPQALALVAKNAVLNNIGNTTVCESDFFLQVPHQVFDIIFSNPPYVADFHKKELQPEVLNWEDEKALFAADKGMAAYKNILEQGRTFFNESRNYDLENMLPRFIFEIGMDQQEIGILCTSLGYDTWKIYNDLSGKPRWIVIW